MESVIGQGKRRGQDIESCDQPWICNVLRIMDFLSLCKLLICDMKPARSLDIRAGFLIPVKYQSGVTMGRRYRRRNNLGSVVTDVVQVASRLPWWGALLVGLFAYLLIYIGLGGYLEGQLAAQEGNQIYPINEARYGRFIRLTAWVGHACLLAGAFFAIRNHCFGANAQRTEKGIVGVIARILGRSID